MYHKFHNYLSVVCPHDDANILLFATCD